MLQGDDRTFDFLHGNIRVAFSVGEGDEDSLPVAAAVLVELGDGTVKCCERKVDGIDFIKDSLHLNLRSKINLSRIYVDEHGRNMVKTFAFTIGLQVRKIKYKFSRSAM